MKVWQWISVFSTVVLLVVCQSSNALGASVSGRSSTVFEWFSTAEDETAIPVYQYLLLNVKDLDGKGLNFRGYGRLAEDLNNEVDVDSRLYYAYLEKKEVIENLDFKAGRQFISTAAGATVMDGLYLNYQNLGPLSLDLFGGGDVAYYEGYNSSDLIVGGEISGHFFHYLDLGLSYVQRWDEGYLANELFGFDLDYHYKYWINIYSETQFNNLTNSLSYFLGGINYHKNPKWSLRGVYIYSLPVFYSTSIYSVFAVEEYQELMTELDYNIRTGLRAFISYTREMYEEVDDANVYEVGVEKIRTKRCSGYLTGIIRDHGEGGQDLMGFKVRVAYLFNKYVEAGVGVHVDVLERRIDENDDESTSSRYWVYGTGYITKKVNVQVKVERVESDLWDEYYQGRVRFNILF